MMNEQPREHINAQRRFYADLDRRCKIRPDDSRSTRRHLDELLSVLGLAPGARILELGCGMGRFSVLLAENGYDVTANDLSPDLLAAMEKLEMGRRIRRICCDAGEIDRKTGGEFDAVIGFFFLHHLDDLRGVFKAAARVLAPGSRVAFCEPNAFNPLFPLQILLSPHMKWAVDGGVLRMRPSVFERAMSEAGIGEMRIRRYGFFPRMISNSRIGSVVEKGIECLRIFRPVSAFQVLSGTKLPEMGSRSTFSTRAEKQPQNAGGKSFPSPPADIS